MSSKRPCLLAISILMIVVCVAGLVAVAVLPVLPSQTSRPATALNVAQLQRKLALDENYIASLEEVVQTSRMALRAVLFLFLLLSAMIAAILLAPSRRAKGAATRDP